MTKITAMTKAKAMAITQRIRDGVESIVTLLRQAYDGKAWAALGHATWEAYVKAEFGFGLSRSYQILDQSRVIEAVREAAGNSTNVEIGESQARAIKGELPAVTAEIKKRVEGGESPDEVAADVVAKAAARKAEQKAARDAEQAKNDAFREANRVALPPAIQQVEKAKAAKGARNAAVAGKKPPAVEALQAEISELRDEVAALNADLAERNKRIATFDDMAVLYEKGGFEEVVKAKDEEIRVLKTRVETESTDKVKWMNKAEWWKKTAIDLGYKSKADQAEAAVSF